jgi:hypothetical protein
MSGNKSSTPLTKKLTPGSVCKRKTVTGGKQKGTPFANPQTKTKKRRTQKLSSASGTSPNQPSVPHTTRTTRCTQDDEKDTKTENAVLYDLSVPLLKNNAYPTRSADHTDAVANTSASAWRILTPETAWLHLPPEHKHEWEDDNDEYHSKNRVFFSNTQSFNQQQVARQRPILLGRDNKEHSIYHPDGTPGRGEGRPYDNILDAPQLEIDHTMHMPTYVAARVVSSAAASNCSVTNVIDKVTSQPTKVSMPLFTCGLNILVKAMPPTRVGHQCLWRGEI